MKKTHINAARKVFKKAPFQLAKLLLECWNDENPHFGRSMPHRYDGVKKFCSYCGRPKDWVKVNPGTFCTSIVEKT